MPQHVVLDRLADVALHQRHVLVGRGVEDDLGAELLEELPHPRLVGDVGDAGVTKVVAAAQGLQLALDA